MNIVPLRRLLLLAALFAPGALAGEGKSKPAAKKDIATAQFAADLAWQIALDGARFSPGILDGSHGRKGDIALADYAAACGLDLKKPEDAATLKAQLGVDPAHATAPYTVGAADLAEVGPLSEDWNERAKLDKLRYPTLHEMLAEKFHCTQALLQRLNPGVKFGNLKTGAVIQAPNLRPFPGQGPLPMVKLPVAAYLRITPAEKTLRAFDAQGKQLALFHCSVAKDKEKIPDRNAVIKTMASPPDYAFDPAGWPEVTNVKRKLMVAPGPRNPVGLAWIGLDLPGYGIHGNPKPELIGKTGSHGCFRLTNWDALALFSMAKVGMKVEITGAEKK